MMFYSEKWMIVTKRRSVQRSALRGSSGGWKLFHFPAWRNVAVTSWGQATVVLTIHWSPLNGAELHNSDTIAILQIHSKIQYLQLSGESFVPPPQNLLDDIFRFLTFQWRPHVLVLWLSHIFMYMYSNFIIWIV